MPPLSNLLIWAQLSVLLSAFACSGKNSISREATDSSSESDTQQDSSAFTVQNGDEATPPEVLAGAYLTMAYQDTDDGKVAVRVNLESQGKRILPDFCRQNLASVVSAVWELRDANGNIVAVPPQYLAAAAPCSKTAAASLLELEGEFDMTWFVARDSSGAVPKLNAKLIVTYLDKSKQANASFEISEVKTPDLSPTKKPATEPSDLKCPLNYVLIPKNDALGTSAFCVMKYEAKNVSNVATSQASRLPWTNIPRGPDVVSGAWKACKNLGAEYSLPSNAQWQAIARNIEGVSSNWYQGTTSSVSYVNRGYSSGSPGSLPLAADANDTNGCFGLAEVDNNFRVDCNGRFYPRKRTHTLSTGEVIWDVSGNVWEWVQDDSFGDVGPDIYVAMLGNFINASPLKWGPAGTYGPVGDSGEYLGFGFTRLSNILGAILRGGDLVGDKETGIFAVRTDVQASDTSARIGFRCVGPATN